MLSPLTREIAMNHTTLSIPQLQAQLALLDRILAESKARAAEYAELTRCKFWDNVEVRS